MTGADRQRIAIVGIATRTPDATGPEEYWQLLRGGVDAVRDRAPARGGGPDRGGFVDGVDEFDAGFFRMSPREAAETDPQQRLALELAWQGLEDAGIPAASVAAPVAVFLGVMAADYADLVVRSGEVTRHSLTGMGRAMIANRISYALGLDGPSMTVDTGQSSSLVAVHLACESLRSGEAGVALAGGVHLNLSPLSTAVVEAAGALSPDGRCFVFDERANGYVRGEGGGVVVLKRLDEAIASGDRIYAVIEGSAVRTGSGVTGLTVPSAETQARTIDEALDRAGLRPEQVQYVELHGTGTPVGDPIEARALGATYGRSRSAPLVVGSVKTNIGHLEGAAGIAGLIKAVLCVHRRELVPNVDFGTPNLAIPLDELGLRVAERLEPWPATGRVAAGVTSLGIGGSCCHLLLTEAPAAAPALPVREQPSAPFPIPVSGSDPEAVRTQAARLHDHLIGRPELDLRDVAFSAATTRTQLEHRAAVVAADRDAALAGLSALAAGDGTAAGVVSGRVFAGRTAVLFTGQGAQRARMGADLARAYPVFDRALGEVCAELDARLGRSLRALLEAAPDSPDAALLHETRYTQPALFAVEVALFRLAESFGVRPDVLIGHSVGELAAAYVAGVLSLADAAELVEARGRLMGALPPGGGMVAVQAAETEVRATLPEGLSVAAVNGPLAVVVSGDLAAIDAWLPRWAGRKTSRLTVSHAFHSALMDPMLAEFGRVAARLTFHEPRIPVVSNLTGTLVSTELTDPGYWVRHVREAVRFHDGVRSLREYGVTRFLELGPDAVLTAAARQTLGDDPEVMLAAAARARRPEVETFAAFLGAAQVAGVALDMTAVLPDARRVELPPYAFRKQQFPLPAADVTAPELYQVDWVPVVAGPAATAEVKVAEAVEIVEAIDAVTTLLLLQRWIAGGPAGTRLMLVTRNGIAAGDEAPDLNVAPVWGLVRSAQSEHPGRFLLVDTDDPDTDLATLGGLAAAGEPQLAIRAGRLLAPRVVRCDAAGPVPAYDTDGTVLITGGTGSLGSAFARHLAGTRGVRRLLLVSRRGLAADGAVELVAELAALGCAAEVVACDVSDRAQVAELVVGRDLTAVVHAAGVLDDGLVVSLTPDRLAAVMRPKGDAARHLHELTADRPLTAFVLFSSVAAQIGSPGQGNYAAANAALDALAAHRRVHGLPATSLAWGLFDDPAGMAGTLDAAASARWARTGIRPLAAGSAAELFDRAPGIGRAVLVPARFDLPALREMAAAGTLPPLLRGLAPIPAPFGTAPVGTAQAPAGTALGQRLAAVRPADRDRHLVELVQGHVAAVLGHGSAGAIDPLRAFKELGFDSLAGVELRNRLIQDTGVEVPSTLVFNHPTTAGVARLLRDLVDGGDAIGRAPVAVRPAAADEPLAIVGISCRYPGGVGSPDDFWSLIADGRDAVTGLPEDRGWDLQRLYDPDPERAGTLYTRGGGFLHDAGDFDAGFFGISPREALATDPQQRLMLEASWQAFEDAGIDPATLRGSDTGVFCGVMSSDDYGSGNPPELEGFRLTGTTNSVVSGRVAYALGLEGPAVSVDTACSSSLVALHLAAQALRNGECSLALAAGVTVMAKPFLLVEFSRQRGLAADGRCKPYAAAADGTGFSDGLGVLVLERLSDARRNGRRIWGLVRGSAVNQDGASNGLTAPNGPSQERVIRLALAQAGLTAGDVDAVEGHGTGTRLGDPIEAQALLATYGRDRGERDPLWLGSVKSNIGHTQAAAGVAGVIKMVQAMRHEMLPRTLHLDAPSPHVDWASGGVRLLTEAQPWPATDRPRRAGISSFGVSGTNAHVIVEEPPAVPAAATPEPGWGAGPVPVLLSARGDDALRAQADRLRALLIARPGLTPLDVAYSTATTRAQLETRAVVIGADRGEMLAGLRALSAGEPAPEVAEGQSATGATVFVFPGQGAQWEGMAVELLDSAPVFAAEIAACEEALSRYVDWKLTDVLRGTGGAPSLQRVDVVQPALFAVMVSLAALWRSYGVRPSTVVGHSQGEIAAAYVAGGLTLDDAARIVAVRSQLVRDRLAGSGGMVSLALPEPVVRELIGPYHTRVSIATVNGPTAVVIAGEPTALDEIVAACERDGVRARRVPVDYASHSPQVEVLRDELLRLLEPIAPRVGEVSFYSTALGRYLDTTELDSGYWYRNLREPVGFEPAVRALIADGAAAFLEISPHPVLTMAMQETAQAADAADRIAVHGSLRRDEGGPRRFLLSLAQAHVAGVGVDWSAWFAGSGAVRVDLPTYAFQRQRYWLMPGAATGDVAAAGLGRLDHPLLAAVVQLGDRDEWMFTGRVSVQAQPWLADHAVFGTVLMPGTGLVELAAATGEQLGCPVVDELVLQLPLVLAADESRQVQVRVGETDGDGRREVAIYSRPPDAAVTDASRMSCHARGWLGTDPAAMAVPFPSSWPPAGAEPVPVDALYGRLAEAGYEYGPIFQGVRAAWRDGADVYTELAVPDEAGTGFGVHPALLDVALHGALLGKQTGSATDLPFSFSGVVLGSGRSRSRARISPVDDTTVRIDMVDEAGDPVATVSKLVFRPVDPAQLERVPGNAPDALFRVDWVTPADAVNGAQAPRLVVGAGVAVPAGTYPDLDALDRALAGGAPVPDLVVAPIRDGADVHATTAQALDLVQRWLASEWLTDARLMVVTAQAVAAGGGVADLDQSPVWGLLRSAQSEHPGRFLLVDTDQPVDTEQPDWAALGALGEPQMAVREGRTLVPRLRRVDPPPPGAAWRLSQDGKASLEDLTLVTSDADRSLGRTEVRVGVRAAGLNFRDVLIALGRYPGDAPLGSEAAGVVLEVGAEVTDLSPGDRVMGLVTDSFGPMAVADRRMLVPMPAGFSFVQAAAIPIAYLTALYGLADLASVGAGDRVLIHAAAGGVGMAAVQLARLRGAEVYATASPAKWDAVEAAGVDRSRIASSRDLGFRPALLAATSGAGVDVVLDALAGEFVDASLDLLPRGGRFVEMGKADIRDAATVAAAHPGVQYTAFDLFDVDRDRIYEMLTEVVDLFEQGRLRHAPVRTWDVRDGREAFRFLREGRNTGKIVLTVPAPLDPEGTILITGGTGGLGALFARHLAATRGAKRLLLLSRRGPAAPGAPELVAELAGLGTEARAVACDAADRPQLAALLDSLDHPLTAVIHAAGVLDDGVIESLTPERLATVMRPKVDAARHLHELTSSDELAAFVLFSSVAALMGTAGQGNYAAANAYLDALAAHRRAGGLAATSLAWGLWADATGMTGELGEADLARLERVGIDPLPTGLGLQLFDQSLGYADALLGPVRLNVASLRAQARAGTLPPLLRGLVRAPVTPRAAATTGSLTERLTTVVPADREQVVLDLVRAQVAAVLGHSSPEAVDADRAFKALGFDSLAAVELRNRLSRATQLRLPTTMIFDHPTPAAVTGFLLASAGVAQERPRPPMEAELAKLEALLSEVAGDAQRLAEAEPRLRAFSNRLRTVLGGGTPYHEETPIDPDDALGGVSDEEMFDLIDKQFGAA